MTCLGDDPHLDGEQLLAAFVDGVRLTYTLGPPPRVGPALAEVLAAGAGTAAPDRPSPVVVPDRAGGGFLGRLQGRRPRVALSAAVASLTFLGVGAAGALPGPAQSAFDRTADAVGVRLPAAGARDSAPPGAHDPGELPGVPPGAPYRDEGTGPAVPPGGARQGAVAPDDPAAADASLAGPAGDAHDRERDAGGGPRRIRPEDSVADDRPAPVPEQGRRPHGGGGPPSGVGPGGATDPEEGAGVGRGPGPRRYRPWWGFPHEERTRPATGPGAGQSAAPSTDAAPEGEYPSTPSRR